jgi:hypothetical protein
MEQPPNQTPNMPMGRRRKGAARKRIERHTDEELDAAVQGAISHCDRHGLDFFRVLHGVDAYMERRRRGDARVSQKIMTEAYDAVMKDDQWGDS